jgi:hypothetical protein
MLAAEFGYSRTYIDTYINMPALRAIMDYREYNPPVGTLLTIVFSDKKRTPSRKRSKKFKEHISSDFSSMVISDKSKFGFYTNIYNDSKVHLER